MARETSTTTPAAKRPRKTRAEKAVAELDAAIKTRDAAQKRLDKLKEGMAPAQSAFDEAEALVTFLQQNPALPEDRRVTVPADASSISDDVEPTIKARDDEDVPANV